MAIKVAGHEGASTTISIRAFLTEALDFARVIYLVVLQDRELHFLLLVLDLLGLRVGLLLPLLCSTPQPENKVESRLFLYVVVGQGSSIFQLLPSKDEPLLIRRDTFLVLDLCLHVINGVRALNLKRDGLSCKRLDEDLHLDVEETVQASNQDNRNKKNLRIKPNNQLKPAMNGRIIIDAALTDTA